MALLLKGAPVAAALNEKTAARAAALRENGVVPTLAIVRVGERGDDIAYETGAQKRCAAAGVEVKSLALPADIGQRDYLRAVEELNADAAVHGILLLRPLPRHIDDALARRTLLPEKDVDGCTDGSLAGVFTGSGAGFTPCTAQAAMEILAHYGIDCAGKNAVVIGRSLVVGRPAAMLLLRQNATVTLCHTGTRELADVVRGADIVIAASGQIRSLGSEYFRPGQTVVDVGIGWSDEQGKLCGDVRLEEVQPVVPAITPVPGGVGTVTSALLASHVAEAAARVIGAVR